MGYAIKIYQLTKKRLTQPFKPVSSIFQVEQYFTKHSKPTEIKSDIKQIKNLI